MSKKAYCNNNPAIAYYSGFSGLEIHGIEYGINDYIYCVSGAWGATAARGYHKLKIKYDRKGNAYFTLHGYKCLLSECIKMEV